MGLTELFEDSKKIIIIILIISSIGYFIKLKYNIHNLEKNKIKSDAEILELLETNKNLSITIDLMDDSHKQEVHVLEEKRNLDKSICDINTKIITIEKTIEFQLNSVDVKYDLISKYQEERLNLIIKRTEIIEQQKNISTP